MQCEMEALARNSSILEIPGILRAQISPALMKFCVQLVANILVLTGQTNRTK